ncbi:glycosyltransferase family 9 protein [Kribbella deserti]|uniref:Glycosyltransferase family 9 protein n=1 Tax=Kribbella deserti TaxID=1926257 RepID=A0ABV6QSA8_9ACTN
MNEPVLVLRALGLGDALTAVPALRGLRRLHPDRPLILAGTEPVGSWLRDQGLVDDVILLRDLDDHPPGADLGPHLAVDLHGRGPQSHRLLLEGKPTELIAFDCPEAGHYSPSVWREDEHEVHRWCRLLTDAGAPCTPADLRLPPPTTPAQHALSHLPSRGSTKPPAARADPATGTGPPSATPAPAVPAPSVDPVLAVAAPSADPVSGVAVASAHPATDGLVVLVDPGDERRVVLVHPGAASGSRRWPANRWITVVRALRERDLRVLITGSCAEHDLCREIAEASDAEDLSGTLDLDDLATLVYSAELLISGDTGVAHLATAYGTRSVTLFGPTPPTWWGPAIDLDLHTVIYKAKPDYRGNPHAADPDPALLAITPTEVLSASHPHLTA